MLRIHPGLSWRQFEVAREPLIEPERHALHHRVEQCMGQFMPQVGPEMVPHPGKDLELVRSADPWFGDEVRAPAWQVAIAAGLRREHVALVALLGVEQEDLNDRVGGWQFQFAVDLIGQRLQGGEDRVLRVEIEVVIEDVAAPPGRMLAGQGGGRRRRGRIGGLGGPGDRLALAVESEHLAARQQAGRNEGQRSQRMRGEERLVFAAGTACGSPRGAGSRLAPGVPVFFRPPGRRLFTIRRF